MKLMPSWVEGPFSGLAFPALRNTSISDLFVIRWRFRGQNSSLLVNLEECLFLLLWATSVDNDK